ncbi:Protein YIF1A [Durusdinium trenchii]|uniref:Protein YIF1A n=1 Tax=Durusdinium trenchii TaxID=1381693 RepID=A0ABP0IE18_9DINO
MFRTGYLQQILSWCEKPGDHYSRAWGLWLVLTMLSYEASEEKLKAQADTLDPEAVLVMEEVSLEEVQVERRNRLLDEQEAAAGKSSAEIQEMRSKQPECKTRIHWLRSSRELIRACALSAGKCISYQWKDSQQLGCVASAWCLVELPEFIQTAVESIDSKVVSKCLTLPEKSLQLAALLLVSVVSSLRLQLNAAGFELGVQDLDFVCEIHTLQEFAVVSSSIFNSLSRLVARETAAAPSGRRAVGLSRDQDRALGHMGLAGQSFLLRVKRLQEPEEQNLMLQEPEVQEQEELQAVQQALQWRAYLEEEAILELQEFLRRFHHMQQILIESLSSSGEGPYDMIARFEVTACQRSTGTTRCQATEKVLSALPPPVVSSIQEVAPRTDDGTVRNAWGVDQTGRRVNRTVLLKGKYLELHKFVSTVPNENEFRCLVSFMIGLDAQLHAAREKPSFSAGQCICPPLASTPSLDLESSLAAPGKSLVPVREPLPPVDPKAEPDPDTWRGALGALGALQLRRFARAVVEFQPSTQTGRAVEQMLNVLTLQARKAVEQAREWRQRWRVVEAEPLGAPPVAECGTPPAALLDKSGRLSGRQAGA